MNLLKNSVDPRRRRVAFTRRQDERRSALALLASVLVHAGLCASVLVVAKQRPSNDAWPNESAGWDAWGIDVALEPSEAAEANEADTLDPSSALTGEAPQAPNTPAAITPALGGSEGALPMPPKPPPSKRTPRASHSAAQAAAPGSTGPLADSDAPASPAPGIGTAARSSLLKDFVWVLSNVNARDEAWHRLPRGPVGQIKLRLTLNTDGRILSSQIVGSAPEHMRRLWDRTRATLERGRFAPNPESPTLDGSLLVLLEARITQEQPEQTETSDPLSPVAYGQTPASAERPGRAYFRFPSGRAVEIFVRQLER